MEATRLSTNLPATAGPPTVSLFDLPFAKAPTEAIWEQVKRWAAGSRPRAIYTPNVDHVVRISRRPELHRVYREADLLVADGMPLVWLSRLFGDAIAERTTGTDLLSLAAERFEGRMFILGGRPGVARQAAERVRRPDLETRGMHGYFDRSEPVLEAIEEFQPHLLAVGLGSPRQELWIREYRDRLQAGVVLAVGGAIEVLAGLRRRAPVWMQEAGFEWAWRLLLEPRRLWRRYLVRDTRFLHLAFSEWRRRREDR